MDAEHAYPCFGPGESDAANGSRVACLNPGLFRIKPSNESLGIERRSRKQKVSGGDRNYAKLLLRHPSRHDQLGFRRLHIASLQPADKVGRRSWIHKIGQPKVNERAGS
jgi:hypothetical protein